MHKHMTQALAALVAALICCPTATAQTAPADADTTATPPPTSSTHSTLFGIGGVRQLDTYLSPIDYRGPQVMFLKEKLRPTRIMRGRVSFQGILQADFAVTHNRADNAHNLSGNLRYDAALHYNWRPVSPLRIMAGPQIGGNVGLIYNTRNGNNPAQALASIDISASAAAIYSFRLWGHTFRLREQVDIPLIGVMFSPNYNQSYYELSLGNRDHNVCFTHPANRPNLRNQLTLDFPLRGATMRVGYLLDVRQSRVNNIRHHTYTHAFVIGWVKHFTYRSHRQAATDGFIM